MSPSAALSDALLFSNLVLLVATGAYLLFIWSLPRQPDAQQRRALWFFGWFFVCEWLAHALYGLRYSAPLAIAILSCNLTYLLGAYLFYAGVRARFALSFSRFAHLAIVLHLLVFTALMYWFSAINDQMAIRLPLMLASLCLPILLSYLVVRRHGDPANLGTLVLKICTITALLSLPLLYPLFSFLLAGQSYAQLMVMTLLTLCLETLCIGGIATSYIYDLIDKLRHDAHTDKLTQARNRRYFFKVASQYQQQAHRGTPVALVLLDIDHFKQINDLYGHQAGDNVLQHFATLLRQQFAGDLIVRYGGEEFLLLLSGRTVAKASAELRQFRTLLREGPLQLPQRVTASFGLCQLSAASAGSVQLQSLLDFDIQQADEALYQAKSNGRDQIVPAAAC